MFAYYTHTIIVNEGHLYFKATLIYLVIQIRTNTYQYTVLYKVSKHITKIKRISHNALKIIYAVNAVQLERVLPNTAIRQAFTQLCNHHHHPSPLLNDKEMNI